MSTELKPIHGKIELISRSSKNNTFYEDSTLELTRFWGGNDRGVSLQMGFVSTDGNYHHIQIDNETVKALIKELTSNF